MNSLDLNRFKAIIFDLDSTLTNTHRYPILACEWLMQKSGVSSEEQIAEYVRILVMRYRNAIRAVVDGAPYQTPLQIIREEMENSLHDIDLKVDGNLVDEATRRFKSLHIELSTPYEGVPELLDTLSEKSLRLGVLSNSFEGNAKVILMKLELDQYFSSILDCGDVKAFKPMSQIFTHIIQELGVDVKEAIYVGDEYYADMVGGKGVGMTTIWINNRDRSLQDLISKYGVASSPDYILHSVSEIGQML
ncbi:MAG: HAD family hydrolase [Promethearchaeota archaeon]